jgi:hypothetical protein
MMYQQEIEFFWPLTEQIPLDLDYSICEKPKLTTSVSNSVSVFNGSTNLTWSTTFKADKIETDEICFTLNKNPGIIKRLVYKFLDINWKVK